MFDECFYENTCILICKVDCKNLKVYNKKVVTSLRAGQASAAKTAHYSVLPKLEKVFTAFFRSTRILASARRRAASVLSYVVRIFFQRLRNKRESVES